ncbi:MAG: glyoxylate/hydroxypyruvate reductase A [Pseudomonadota bacterium]
MTTTRTIGLRLDDAEHATILPELRRAAAASGRDLTVDPDADPTEIDYLVYNIDSGVTEFSAFPKLRAIFNTWAGVEAVVGRITVPDGVPFCRMVESGMTDGMSEYFVAHTMRYLIDIDRAQAQSAGGLWQKWTPRLARQTPVGILGLGQLGAETGRKLAELGFPVYGWSRSLKSLDGIFCHADEAGLSEVLEKAQILILILPLTDDTREIMNAERLAQLPKGACLINAGRGPLIDDTALLDALASGHLKHATLDVFREEPLPGSHPFWRHPGITITPHIAAETRMDTAADAILVQICRDLDNAALQHIVDPVRGY